MATIVDVTDTTFEEEVLKSAEPVLVDFWAEWCAPCRVLAPVIHEIAEEHGGRLRVCKMDVDASPATPAKFSIRSVPTLLFFRNGEVVDSLVGAVPKRQLEEKISQLLA